MVAATSLSEATAATTLATVDGLSDRYIGKVDKSTILGDCVVSEHCQHKETIMVGFNDQSSRKLLVSDCCCGLVCLIEGSSAFSFHGMSVTSSFGC
jgi:hypothetical protein